MKKPINPFAAVVVILAVIGAVAWYIYRSTAYDPGTVPGPHMAAPKGKQ